MLFGIIIRTYFCGTVDVLDGEDVSQAVEQHFCQSWNQLSGGDQDIHTFSPVGGVLQTHRVHTGFKMRQQSFIRAQTDVGPGASYSI